MTPEQAADPAEFATRMVHMLNEAGLALMVSVGHRTGLFDVMATMPAARLRSYLIDAVQRGMRLCSTRSARRRG